LGLVNATTAPPFSRFAAGGDVVSLDRARARRQLAARTALLSDRELAVVEQLARGLVTEEIAEQMFLSPHTIRSHVKTAMRKLDARTRAHAVAIALTADAIEPVQAS
jgi:DNA-binding CsgD family transcriptional regulator